MDDRHAKSAPKRAQARTARLFRNGRNQAVRLPKEYELDAEEVYIEHQGERLILTPKPRSWEAYFAHGRRLSEDLPETIEDLPPQPREAL